MNYLKNKTKLKKSLKCIIGIGGKKQNNLRMKFLETLVFVGTFLISLLSPKL